MKYETFIILVSGLIDQYNEDCYISNTLEELFRTESEINLGNKLIDSVFNSLIEEFNLDEERIQIAMDIIFNEVLAFKYNGQIYEGNIENLFYLFNNTLT